MLWRYKEKLHEQPSRKRSQSCKQAIHREKILQYSLEKANKERDLRRKEWKGLIFLSGFLEKAAPETGFG